MREHGRTIICQVPVVPDDEPLGLADQLRQPPLAFDQQHVVQIGAVKFDQVEREKHRLLAVLLAPQCPEIRRSVVAQDHDCAVDQERMRVDAKRGVNDGGEAVGPVMTVAGEATEARAVPVAPSADRRHA